MSLGRRTYVTLMMCAGLAIAPVGWAINMQAGQILPYGDCVGRFNVSAAVSVAALALALVCATVSWRYKPPKAAGAPAKHTLRFIASLSGLTAAAFSFALALQTAATLALSGCQR